MNMTFGDVNFFAILVAALAKMVIGAFWYSPKVFGEFWAKESGLKCEDCKAGVIQYIVMFLSCLVTAWVLALIVNWMHVQNLAQGVALGFFIWLGFVATTQLSAVLWGRQPIQVYLVNNAYLLLSIVVMSGILTVWR